MASHKTFSLSSSRISPPVAYHNKNDKIDLQDQHVEQLTTDNRPDLVLIQVYITNAKKTDTLAKHYTDKGVFIELSGLHVTSLPN